MIPHSHASSPESSSECGGFASWDHKFSAALCRGSGGSRETPDNSLLTSAIDAIKESNREWRGRIIGLSNSSE